MKKNQSKSIRKYNKNWNATVANSNINKKKLEQLLSRRNQKKIMDNEKKNILNGINTKNRSNK